ncbi:BON domain-containing protein [Methylomicrobium lacus]|uniref:BON domain-containing protein n=1 Tax=Methylomicrobium lacus TaxID=136992 RepID=UPI00045E93C2|nr:BON domain-containing protein [Methylomicrobium lacus]
MSARLSLIMFTLTVGLNIMTGTVRAEQDAAIYLAAGDSALDNTGRNVRDKSDATLTPEDQMENESDITITATIRQAVVKDELLSVNAQNIKIITRNGVVTLRGPVKSEAESMKLQQIAKQTPGVVQVDNQLENIAP